MNAYQISNKASIYNNDVGEPMQAEFTPSEPVEHDHQRFYPYQFLSLRWCFYLDSLSYFGSQEWLLDYGENQLGVNFQQSAIEVDKFFPKTGVQGNLWQDCLESVNYDESVCIRMAQLRNVRKFIGDNATIDHLDEAIMWIGEILDEQGHYPTLIVFQEFSDHIPEIIRKLRRFVFQKMSGATEGYNVIGVAFTLMNKNISNADVSLCNAVHHVPILNMGSLPLESYYVLRFNPFEHLGASQVYRADVVNQNSTSLHLVDFLSQRCI